MRNIFAEGQLDESALTFKDLNRLSETFTRIVTGIFHHRIEYPEATGKEDKKKAQMREALTGVGGAGGIPALSDSVRNAINGHGNGNGGKPGKPSQAKNDTSEPAPPAYPQPVQGGKNI